MLQTISQLQTEVEVIGLRGLRAASTQQLNWLRSTRDSLAAMGAEYLSSQMDGLLSSVEQDRPDVASQFMDLLTTVRVFDRVLTLQIVEAELRAMEETESN